MDFVVNECTKENIDEIVKLIDEVYFEMENKEIVKKYTIEELLKYLVKPNTILGIYNSNGNLVGLGIVKLGTLEDSEYLLELINNNEECMIYETAFVNRDYRGRAFQKVLGQVMEEIARDYNINLMCSFVHKDNTYGNRNMKKLGYKLKKTIFNENLYYKRLDEDLK